MTDNQKKFLFLDVDGPLKPARCYLSEKLKDANYGGFDPLAVQIVNAICRRTGAKVVFNTTWNQLDIFEIAIREGILGPIGGKTSYPNEQNRLDAILKWLIENNAEDALWVSFDDCKIAHPNAIDICPENGISVQNYREATYLLGDPDKFRVLV